MKKYQKKAQGVTEYVIFIAAVLAGLLALQVYYQRAVKGNVKSRADSIGEQLNTKGGSQILESRSVAARQSKTGNATGGGAWSRSNILDFDATGGYQDTIKAVTGQERLYEGKYRGGEISSTSYVQEFGATGKRKVGTSSAADLGYVNTTDSVWNDSGT